MFCRSPATECSCSPHHGRVPRLWAHLGADEGACQWATTAFGCTPSTEATETTECSSCLSGQILLNVLPAWQQPLTYSTPRRTTSVIARVRAECIVLSFRVHVYVPCRHLSTLREARLAPQLKDAWKDSLLLAETCMPVARLLPVDVELTLQASRPSTMYGRRCGSPRARHLLRLACEMTAMTRPCSGSMMLEASDLCWMPGLLLAVRSLTKYTAGQPVAIRELLMWPETTGMQQHVDSQQEQREAATQLHPEIWSCVHYVEVFGARSAFSIVTHATNDNDPATR